MIKRLLKVAFAEWKLIYTDPAAVLLLVVAGVIYAFYYPVPYIHQRLSTSTIRPCPATLPAWRRRRSRSR